MKGEASTGYRPFTLPSLGLPVCDILQTPDEILSIDLAIQAGGRSQVVGIGGPFTVDKELVPQVVQCMNFPVGFPGQGEEAPVTGCGHSFEGRMMVCSLPSSTYSHQQGFAAAYGAIVQDDPFNVYKEIHVRMGGMWRRNIELALAGLISFIRTLVGDSDHAFNGTDNYQIRFVYKLFHGPGGSQP